MAKAIKFWRGSRSQFDTTGHSDSSTLYFITDQDVFYKGKSLQAINHKFVSSYPSTGVPGWLYFNTTDGSSKYYQSGAWHWLTMPVVTTVSNENTNQQLPSALAVYTAINNVVAQIGGVIHPAVQDITALKAIPADDRSDKMLTFVQDAGSLYRYNESDSASSDSHIPPNVVVPSTDPTGRYYRMFTAINLTTTTPQILDVTGTAVNFKYDSNEALKTTSSGLAVNYDSSTLITDSSTHALKLNYNAAQLQVTASGLSVKKDSSIFTTTSSGVTLKYDTDDFVIGSGGIALKQDYIKSLGSVAQGHIPVVTSGGQLTDGGVQITSSVRGVSSATHGYVPTQLAVANAVSAVTVVWLEQQS